MYRKKTPTVNNWVDKILKSFLNPKGFIEFTNDVDPEFIQKMDQGKTIPNPFLIVLKDENCPKCGAKLNKNGNVKFNLNNTLLIFKKQYSCSIKKQMHLKFDVSVFVEFFKFFKKIIKIFHHILTGEDFCHFTFFL